jgi:hypothetical protein
MTIARFHTVAVAAASIILAGLAVPAAAQTQGGVASSTDQGSSSRDARGSAENNRRICVRASITGSRLTREICRTRAEWERDGGIPTD